MNDFCAILIIFALVCLALVLLTPNTKQEEQVEMYDPAPYNATLLQGYHLPKYIPRQSYAGTQCEKGEQHVNGACWAPCPPAYKLHDEDFRTCRLRFVRRHTA